MSSLRPQEAIRKAIAAGYGNVSPSEVGSSPDDGTYQLCKATVAVEYGDWVCTTTNADGHPSLTKPATATVKKWLGVVQHKAAANEWVRVKTAGTAYAKVDAGAAGGDLLEVYNGSFSARKLTGTSPCARFLYQFAGDTRFALVLIGGGADDLTVHHHADASNTQVKDLTSGTAKVGLLWHVWRVVSLSFTGDDLRLMTALGGGTTHGESSKEGYGWAGVIGANAKMGFGEIGGNETGGRQGVLGAEKELDSDETHVRINVRSWAGYNARDRYGPTDPVIGPIRFTWCGTDETPATWYVPDGCDCLPGVTPAEVCGTGLWWAGTMRMDSTLDPATLTNTNWHRQWVPQFRVERDCCEVDDGPDEGLSFPCGIVANPDNFNYNKDDAAGVYENVIPYNYIPCTGRLDVLHAVCYLANQIIGLWKWEARFSSVVDQMFKCVDTRLAALGQPACCGTVTPAQVPSLTGGPSAATCLASECD